MPAATASILIFNRNFQITEHKFRLTYYNFTV